MKVDRRKVPMMEVVMVMVVGLIGRSRAADLVIRVPGALSQQAFLQNKQGH